MPSFSAAPVGQNVIEGVAIGTAAAGSTAINIQDFNAGVIAINTAAISGVTVTPYLSDKEDGTYMPLYLADDSAADPIVVTSAQAYALPSRAMHGNWLKLVGGSAIADTTVTLKCI